MKNKLKSEHRTDLEKSGLSDKTILESGIYSIAGDEARELLGCGSRQIQSAMVFPYENGFVRLKVFPSYKDRKNRKVKYLQPKGSKNRIYVPAGARKHLGDSGKPLYIAEGEKKALRAVQAGLCCVGLSGVWGWKQDGRVLSDLLDIPMEGRKVILVPDSDLQSNPNVQAAVRELWKELARKGAGVRAVVFPPPKKGKVGLDDFLITNSMKEFNALPRIKHKSELPNFPAIYKRGTGKLALISMGRLPEPAEEENLLGGLIAREHLTTLYGDGGQGKSFIGLALAIAFASGKRILGYRAPKGSVIYLDWELSIKQQQRRAYAVARGMDLMRPPKRLLYGNPWNFVTEILPKLREEIEKRPPVLIVIDSAGLACGVSPEAADAVMDVYGRLVALKTTCLLIDHQSKLQEGQTSSHKTIFGSTYKFALSRSVLHVQKAFGSLKNPLKVRIQHKKNNFGSMHDDIGLRIEFSDDPNMVRIKRFDLAADPDTRAFLPAQGKILDSLKREGSAEVSELMKRLDLPERTVSNSLLKLMAQGLVEVLKKKRGRRKVWSAVKQAGGKP